MWSQNETKLFGMRMVIQLLQSQNETEYYGRRGERGREREGEKPNRNVPTSSKMKMQWHGNLGF